MAFEITKLAHQLAAFKAARSGALSVLLALGLPAVLGVVGAASDYAAITQSRSRLQAATDSAAISIAKEMTFMTLTPQRVQELANAYVIANLGGDVTPSVIGSLQENGFAVRIEATQQAVTPFNIIPTLGGVDQVTANALARVTASTMQNKLCLLSLGDKIDGGLFMHNGAQITGPDCLVHSNSIDRNAIVVQAGSKIKANLVCAKGGINNLAGILESVLLSDCPTVKDPLKDKPEPAVNGACNYNITIVLAGVTTLNPGTYCNGLYVFGTAKVRLNPGVYVFRDGPFVVAGSADMVGDGVSIVLTGRSALFRIHESAYLKLSAPNSGVAAGMLVWESKNWQPGLNSWKNGGCGTVPVGIKAGNITPSTLPPVDLGPAGCTKIAEVLAGMKKVNEHYISANRVRELTGTIYLPQGLLLIDSGTPVADLSPFTLMVVNKLDLYDGPNLVLNANYSSSTVPVPKGLGALGATNVRLGM